MQNKSSTYSNSVVQYMGEKLYFLNGLLSYLGGLMPMLVKRPTLSYQIQLHNNIMEAAE